MSEPIDKTQTDAPVSKAPQASAKAVYFRLLTYVKPYWKWSLLSVIGLALAGLTEPVLPHLLKLLLDDSFGRQNASPLWIVPFALISLFLVRGILTFATSFGINWVANKVLVDIRAQMFDRLIRMPASFYNRESAGKIISRLVFEVNNLTNAAVGVLISMIQETLVIVGLLGYLLYLNWQLTLIAIVLVPVIAWAVSFAGKRVRSLSRQNLQVTGEMAHIVEEAVVCQKVIKVFEGQEREANRFKDASEKLRAFARRVTVAEAAVTPITQLLASFALAAVVTIAIYQSRSDKTTIGGFVAFVTAMLMLLAPLKRVASINSNLQKGIASAQVVFDLLDQAPEADTGTKQIERSDGVIDFELVSLRYQGADNKSLDDVSLSIRSGEVVALVGPSGGGKTSLANLLMRFYEPTEGRVLLDGVPVSELTLHSLRAQIAVVSQETMLFNDTIRANIAFGQSLAGGKTGALGVSDVQIMKAATAAYLADTIRALPQGLDTIIGDNGNLLSGGQRQRLAIARAVLKDAPILVLDEATSALDNESERFVQQALTELMKGRTTIVIAHRLSTVQNADRIVVMDKGRIAEQGTHSLLLSTSGIYARLYNNESFEN
jgi:ATP-binding cassette, subfamily B, bacterial MsbA